MKKILAFLFLIQGVSNLLNAQSPEPVFGIAKQQKPTEWYIQQAQLWKREVEKNNLNAEAWKYYYQSNRNISYTGDGSESIVTGMTDSLNGILTKMKEVLPDSYEYNYLMYYNGSYFDNEGRINYYPYLFKSFEINPDRSDIYPDLVVYAETSRDLVSKKKYLQKWFDSNQMSAGILSWCYNLLQSTAPNAVLVTNGDNDTFPIWMLQEIKGVRTDVLVINTSLFLIEGYRKIICDLLNIPMLEFDYDKIKNNADYNTQIGIHLSKYLTKRPLYFAISSSPDCYKTFEDSMYNEGLAMRFSEKKYDNLSVLRTNVEQKFLLDYLKLDLSNDISKDIVTNCNTNYLTSMLLLFEYYSDIKDKDKTTYYYNLILEIATNAGLRDKVEPYLNQKIK